MMPPLPTRVRELSDEQVVDLRENIRFLLREGDWSVRELNQALGFDAKSNALRNILNDKTGKASTTRVRYEALKRIRDEEIEPGIVLVEPEQVRSRQRSKNKPEVLRGTNPVRRRARSARSEVTLEPADSSGMTLRSPVVAEASSALVFKMGGTEFSATQKEDGDWQVILKTACSAAQMVALAELVMADGLNISLSRLNTVELVSAE